MNQEWTAKHHPRLIEAGVALNENQLNVAERLLKAHLKEDPYNPSAIRMLAEIAGRLGRWTDAENLLRRAVEIAPDWTAAKANLVLVLGRTGRASEALGLLDDIFREEPDDVGHWNLKAATLGRLGQFDGAIQLYKQALDKAPQQPRSWLSYGHMLKTVGRVPEGVAAYRRAIEMLPSLGEAWWSLANLKTLRFDEADIAIMQEQLRSPQLREEDRIHFNFALGKAMHDLGRYDDAFAYYAAGNVLRLNSRPYRPDEIKVMVDRCIELGTAAAFTGRSGGCPAPDPIFIVGLPRSGSTLVEQILSSHSQVEGISELADVPALARKRGRYPDDIFKLDEEARRGLGEDYLRRVAPQRRTDQPFFIDKLPNNWLYVPFIQLILPNAKIVDARRHPMACGFANFRQHFANGQDFTYDLGHVGQYYADYVRLMTHMDEVLPGRVHRVIYERMVDDTESEVRALLAYCGLEFEPACLEFHRTERAIRTPSSEQVRQPIYRDATDEWRAYEAHLGPLKEAIGSIADTYADAPAT